MLLVPALLAATPNPGPTPSPADCVFHLVDTHWQGTCKPLFDRVPEMTTLTRANASATGAWRQTPATAIWTGSMGDQPEPDASIELDIYPGATGVLRTAFGWFPAADYSLTASTLHFQVDASRNVPPSELDRQIVQRAAAMLSSDSVWSRSGSQRCPANATQWSIYCAMMHAMIDVAGAIDDQRPAMTLLRQAVDVRTEGRKSPGRLTNYNKDPSTRLEDVQSLFAGVLARTDWVQ